jgi:DNA-binding transcriptional regulator YiaG
VKTLRELVTELGSQEKAARSLDVPLATFSNWLHGKQKVSNAYIKVLKSKGISVEELKLVDKDF